MASLMIIFIQKVHCDLSISPWENGMENKKMLCMLCILPKFASSHCSGCRRRLIRFRNMFLVPICWTFDFPLKAPTAGYLTKFIYLSPHPYTVKFPTKSKSDLKHLMLIHALL
jgi:hypothetical protein